MNSADMIEKTEPYPASVAARSVRRIQFDGLLSLGSLFGLADSAVSFTYAFKIDVTIFYVAALLLKVVILTVRGGRWSRNGVGNYTLLLVIGFGLLVGFFDHEMPPYNVLAPIGFVAHLLITGTFVRRPEAIRAYARSVTIVTLALIIFYLAAWLHGDLENAWGRYFFLGGEQPNLGGELIAAGIFVSGIYLDARKFLLLSILSLLPVLLMQSRAALLVIFCYQAICLYFLIRHWPLWLKSSIALALCGIGLLFSATIDQMIDNAFLLSDINRGLGTGFVGRDILWQAAIDAFNTSPLVGHGLGYFDSISSPGAHNLFLFVLAENGIIGLVIIGWIFYGVFRSGLTRQTLWFAPFILLAAFNDRFVNLNPYPFLFYVFMWIPAGSFKIRSVKDPRASDI